MTIRTDCRPGDEILAEAQAAEHIQGICLKTGPPRQVGVELEWLVRDARDPALPVPPERIATAVQAFATPASGDHAPGNHDSGTPRSRNHGPGYPSRGDHGPGKRPLSPQFPRSSPGLPSQSAPGILPSGAYLTAEPGGQLELSSLPAGSLAECVSATARDLAALREAAASAGLELAGYGLDPLRPPKRVLDLPRYAAMEAFFDRSGPWGRQMMCSTASVQVCLDAGDESDGPTGYRWRWRLVHAIGPVLVAAFANSPLRAGRPTGWRSSRQQVWTHMDPCRTRPPQADGDPRASWARYALEAEVMCVRDPDSPDWTAPPGMTLRDWIEGDRAAAPPEAVPPGAPPPRRTQARPTGDDVNYHLSTLFPPVRLRGHLELRMIDAQPGDGWIVPLAVATALMDDPRAADTAMAAIEPLPPAAAGGRPGDPWLRAARLGPADPVLARASRECFAAARAALDRMGAPALITAAVDVFMQDYVMKDRCPADDELEEAR